MGSGRVVDDFVDGGKLWTYLVMRVLACAVAGFVVGQASAEEDGQLPDPKSPIRS
jgi:hypothetical protein